MVSDAHLPPVTLQQEAANRFSQLAPVSWSDNNEVIQEAAAAINTRLVFCHPHFFLPPCCTSYILPCFPVTCRAVTGIKAEHLV